MISASKGRSLGVRQLDSADRKEHTRGAFDGMQGQDSAGVQRRVRQISRQTWFVWILKGYYVRACGAVRNCDGIECLCMVGVLLHA